MMAEEADKHLNDEDHIEINESLLIDPNLLTVTALINSGDGSVIYEGRYKGAPIALKIIKPALDASNDQKYKILREIKMLSLVNHENIVKFIGATKHPNLIIVTEYMKSGSLKNYLYRMRPHGGLDLKRCIQFALDISKAMEYLHGNRIIHRDLKPSNLLVSENHKNLKLCDFGLAREETLTRKMSAGAGTLRWMAPELFGGVSLTSGEKIHYDHKVDVYSFSMVLWEMLSNSKPYEGMGNIQAAYATMRNVRPSLEKVPKRIVPLLESCWAADPSHRPEFTHITTALSEFLQTFTPSFNSLVPLLMIDEEDDEGEYFCISRAAEVADSVSSSMPFASTVVNDPMVHEVKEVVKATATEKHKRSFISKFYNLFRHCFSKRSTLAKSP